MLGDLYTWGKNTGSLGYAVSQTVQSVMIPKKLPEFSGNVSKVVLGLSHSAVITSNFSLFWLYMVDYFFQRRWKPIYFRKWKLWLFGP